jgi:hypothetical protein
MKFIYFGGILLMWSFLLACQDSYKKKQEHANQEGKSPEQTEHLRQQRDSSDFQGIAAQVSDSELQQFLTIKEVVDSINQELKEKTLIALEKGNMDIERFKEIRAVAQDPTTNTDVNRADLENFKTVYNELKEIQHQAEQKISDRLEEAGMEEDRYRKIDTAFQNSPALQERAGNLPQGSN